jgi:molybdopterin converting factor small subunit
MNIITNVFGPDITLKQKIFLELTSPTLRDVLKVLKDRHKGPWERIIKDDLSIEEGCVILINGRNIWSLEKFETRIRDGDEITFTVLVSGG